MMPTCHKIDIQRINETMLSLFVANKNGYLETILIKYLCY